MLHLLEHTIIDTIKLLPFLYITYLIMEYIENKTTEHSKEVIKKSGKWGPFFGGLARSCATMWIFCICNESLCR